MNSSTDRRIRSPNDLDRLAFDEGGLVPVVSQQAASPGGGASPSAPPPGAVLMVAWANREALERTLASGFMHYWSRSRRSLWKKGESSGNLQRLVSLHDDCDSDTVLARVRMEGPACHTLEATCFGSTEGEDRTRGFRKLQEDRELEKVREPERDRSPAGADQVIAELWKVVEQRDRERPEGSYTTRLLTDENLRLKKLGEEAVELVISLTRRDGRAPEEAADLLYHVLVGLRAAGHDWHEVAAELRRRRG